MKEFEYVIRDPLGLHARPAGLLVQTAKPFQDTAVTITRSGQTVKATQLMKLMTLGIRTGDTVVVRAEGPQEEAAIAALRAFFQSNL